MRTATALLVAGLLGCGGLPDADEPLAYDGAAVGLVPGEAMAFEVRVAGVLVGTAQLAVGEPGQLDGRPALEVTSRITTAGLAQMVAAIDDQAITWIDRETWLPLVTRTDATYGPRRTRGEARYQGSIVEGELARDDKPPTRIRHDVGDALAFDAHAAMAAVRVWSAQPGDARTLWIAVGRRLWRTELACVGGEYLDTAAGPSAAIRFDGVSTRTRANLTDDPKAKVRTFSVWLSADADRVPLRVVARTELGEAEITLTDYRGPR